MKYGREVRGFDQTLWEQERDNIVLTGSYPKFRQNSEFRQHLLGSGDKIVAETSPFDRIWGIGLGADDPDACRQSTWRGQKLLGIALQKVRQLLRSNAPPPNVVLAFRQWFRLPLSRRNEVPCSKLILLHTNESRRNLSRLQIVLRPFRRTLPMFPPIMTLVFGLCLPAMILLVPSRPCSPSKGLV